MNTLLTVERGDSLRSLMTGPRPYVMAGPGIYDFGHTDFVLLPPGKQVKAGNPLGSRLINYGGGFSARACCWELNDGVLLDGLQLVSQCQSNPAEQSQVVGFQGDMVTGRPNTTNATASILNGLVEGRSFGIYNWGGDGNKIIVINEIVYAGRWGFTAGQASGAAGCFYEVLDSYVYCDYGRFGGAGGSIGESTVGFLARGGTHTLTRVSFRIMGHSTKHVYGVWLTPQPGTWTTDGSWPRVTLKDCESRVVGNGSPTVLDVCVDIGELIVDGGRGSGLAGEFYYRGNVKFVNGACGVLR